MELSRVIVGAVTTEKSEMQKQQRVYTLRIDPAATKVLVANALQTLFGVKVQGVRIQRIRLKSRLIGAGRSLTKRHPSKRALVTLTEKSKALDLSQFKAS